MTLAVEMVTGGFSAGQAAAAGGQYNSFAAAGSTITDATRISSSLAVVTGADGSKGVYLQGQVGDEFIIFNNAGSTLKVYGDTSSVAISVGGTGLGTAGTAFSHLTYKTVRYVKVSSTQYLSIVGA